MIKLKHFIKWLLIILLGLIVIGVIFPTWTPKIKGENSISILKQVEINGAKHEIMIRGNNLNNPFIIFVHGGPGCSEIPYVTKYQDILEKDFTIVHYDQRGSGKSYHFFEDYSNLSTELLVNDLLKLTDYILEKYNQDKVLLIGHSFGTYIALQAAQKSPEKYIAYIGIGQMANTKESELDSFNYCMNQAEIAKSYDDITQLEGLKSQIEKGEILTPRNYVRKYKGASRLIDDNKDYTNGFITHPEYNLLDVIRYFRGVSISQNILLSEALENPITNIVTELEIPCYFHMGYYDYMTSSKAAKKYLDSIVAPEKEYVEYSYSAHYPQFEEKEKFAQWLKLNFGKEQ